MDEFLCEASEKDADLVGKLMCESYEYASKECYNWHINNPHLFPNQGVPDFWFNLDGGYKKSLVGIKGNYLQTH